MWGCLASAMRPPELGVWGAFGARRGLSLGGVFCENLSLSKEF